MTLLEAIQEFTSRIGFERPLIVSSSTDPQVKQFQGIANMVLEELTRMPRWQGLTRKAEWTSTATVSQGSLSTLAPEGFLGIIPDTLWDVDAQQKYCGPLTAEQRSLRTGGNLSSPIHEFYVQNNTLYLTEAPTAGHDFIFEYHSAAVVQDPDDSSYKKRFTKDNDVFLLEEGLLLAGLQYLWRLDKGLPFAEYKRTFEKRVAQHKALDIPQTPVSMHGPSMRNGPGIIVPSGSWDMP